MIMVALYQGISMNLAGIEGTLPLIVMTSLFGLFGNDLIFDIQNVNEPVCIIRKFLVI